MTFGNKLIFSTDLWVPDVVKVSGSVWVKVLHLLKFDPYLLIEKSGSLFPSLLSKFSKNDRAALLPTVWKDAGGCGGNRVERRGESSKLGLLL